MAQSSRLSRFAFSFFAFFAIWIAFTSSFDPQELIVGALFSFISAYFYSPHFNQAGIKNLSPKKIGYLLVYLFVFFWEMVKANLDVAYRVLHPKMPIRPGIVEFRTRLKSNVGKLALANSITLTPGTLTVDVIDDRFFVHWIWAPTDDKEKAYEEIAGKFERYLREIYE